MSQIPSDVATEAMHLRAAKLLNIQLDTLKYLLASGFKVEITEFPDAWPSVSGIGNSYATVYVETVGIERRTVDVTSQIKQFILSMSEP